MAEGRTEVGGWAQFSNHNILLIPALVMLYSAYTEQLASVHLTKSGQKNLWGWDNHLGERKYIEATGVCL